MKLFKTIGPLYQNTSLVAIFKHDTCVRVLHHVMINDELSFKTHISHRHLRLRNGFSVNQK